MSKILAAHKAGFTAAQIGSLVRSGYDFHEAARAFLRFDDAATEKVVCHCAYLNGPTVHHLKAEGFSALEAKKHAVRDRDRKLYDPTGQLTLATTYGFSRANAQSLIDQGYKYEYGCFIRREHLASGDYRVKTAFLTDNGSLRRTHGVAETPAKAQRRAYRFARLIREHGRLITAFHAEANQAANRQSAQAA